MNFCPHCHSGNDPVLKDTTWSCGVRFNDALWRTKECYKRQIHVGYEHLRLQEQHISELEEENGRLKQRIKRLEGHIEYLESVGDSLFNGVTRIEAEQRWHKAKEAKL